MLCSELQLVKYGDGYEDIKPLPCNRWTCGFCASRRRRALVALAASGEPNKILTLTVNAHVGESPTHRRDMLHDAWKRLVKRMLRQFALPPERRWRLTASERSARRAAIVAAITAKTAQGAAPRLPYMAFLEKTKLGEPHLHILLRCPFVPQDWLSEQMADLIGSPVVWIEAIKGTAAAVRYVTKYVGKAPAQFGTGKRYWVSRGWLVAQPAQVERPVLDRGTYTVRRKRWDTTLTESLPPAWEHHEIEDGWFRFTRQRHDVRESWAHDLTWGWWRDRELVLRPPPPGVRRLSENAAHLTPNIAD